jgi:hypothetical protein
VNEKCRDKLESQGRDFTRLSNKLNQLNKLNKPKQLNKLTEPPSISINLNSSLPISLHLYPSL